jgi:type II secretory pathway component PulF
MDASQIFRNGIFWLAFFCMLIIASCVTIRVRSRPRNPIKPFLLSRIGDFVKWHLPVFHWFEWNYSLLRLVEVMRLSLDSGSTIDKAIRAGLASDINYCFRSRVRTWSELIERGESTAWAARRAKLSPALIWAFDCGGNDMPNVLETIETCFRSNYSYRVNMARFILWPCLTLLMGVVVGFVVYAIFLPQIKLITYLTTWYTP